MKTFHHIGQVLAINGAAFWVWMAHLNDVLTFVSLASAIAYTFYRFYKDYKKKSI